MSSAIAEIVKLRAENERLRAEVDHLKRLVAPVDDRFSGIGLTATERRIVSALYDKSPKWTSTEWLFEVGRFDRAAEPDSVLRVFIWRIRQKLNPLGVTIATRRGEGAYWMGLDSKARLDALTDKDGAQ